jgi:NADH:ubiquinone oxidoreductase subunit 4 (subunit M)
LIDLDRIERGILLSLAIPIVWIGLYPNPILRRVEPAVLEILYQMDRRSITPEVLPVDEVETEFAKSPAASKARR